MRDLKVTDLAEADLESIGDYFAEENPFYAERLIVRLRTAFHRIASAPDIHSRVPQQEESGIRRMVSGRYLIFYVFTPATVTILRVIHGARDYEPIIFPDDTPD